MLDSLGEPLVLALIGMAGGLMLGLAARIGRFCSMGAIEDGLYGGDWRRLRMWALAIGTAIIATHAAGSAGLANIESSAYLAQAWNPWASVLGGLVFGYGMALSGNCGFGALARVGGGDFRAFVIVITIGISAFMALSGPLAEWRVTVFPVFPAAESQGIAQGLGGALGIAPIVIAIVIGLAMIALALADREFRTSPTLVFWSMVVALAIASGWVGTTWVADYGFADNSIESHTFASPVGETILYLMTASGTSLSFGVGSVLGVLGGAFIGSLIKGHFRWEACEDPRELRRQFIGAVLMGFGAAVSVGCTVGQGLSAFSLLAYSAPVTAISIFAGAALGLKQLITGFLPAE